LRGAGGLVLCILKDGRIELPERAHEAQCRAKCQHNWHDCQCEHYGATPRRRSLARCAIAFAIDRFLRAQLNGLLQLGLRTLEGDYPRRSAWGDDRIGHSFFGMLAHG
jgi:hypothetical protein